MQVLLDKNPTIKTVVNKLDSIQNEFRVFPMEVIAGPTSMETEVVQHGSRCDGVTSFCEGAGGAVQAVGAAGVMGWVSGIGAGTQVLGARNGSKCGRAWLLARKRTGSCCCGNQGDGFD